MALSPPELTSNSCLCIFVFIADGFTVQEDLGGLPEQSWE